MLITVSGIDCSGKSTQIGRLERALCERGFSVRSFWHRPGYSAELDAVRALVRSRMPGALPSAGRSSERDEAFSRPGVSQTWVTVALTDMVLQYAVKLRALLATNDVVICDRYIEDAALDFALRFPEMSVEKSLLFEIVRRLSPRPDLSLMLTISRDEMLRRMIQKDEPFPDPPEVRDRRFEMYRQLAESGRVRSVDASQSIERVHQELIRAVELVSPTFSNTR